MKKTTAFPYTNRELSWLDFNARVLEEAYEKENPILERCKFLGITASNLDEFFMVRVAGLQEQVRSGYKEPDPAGLTPSAQLRRLEEAVHAFVERQYNCFARSLLPQLKKQGITLPGTEELTPDQRDFIAEYFEKVLFPVLTPWRWTGAVPFPCCRIKASIWASV